MKLDADQVADLDQRLRELSRRLDNLLDADTPFPTETAEVRQRLGRGLGSSADVRLVSVATPGPEHGVLVAYIDGIVDNQRVAEAVVRPLGQTTAAAASWQHTALASAGVKAESRWSALLTDLTEGSTVIFASGLAHAWVADTAKYVQRDVTRPQTELAVRGPEQAFIEVLSVQKAQLRQALGSTALRFTDLHVGRTAQSTVAVAHLAGVTNPSLVDAVVGRIQQIDVAGISTSTQIAGLIRDHPRSIFPTVRATERVDVATWHILQGGAAVLTNGDPFVLLAPAPLVSFYRTAMDYSTSWADAAFTRLIRLISWGLG
ncbi:MAG: spore germination protein, partial [Thermaerobacter sp.]|nr:spore germination protein [Thermaerobacter sp.]